MVLGVSHVSKVQYIMIRSVWTYFEYLYLEEYVDGMMCGTVWRNWNKLFPLYLIMVK